MKTTSPMPPQPSSRPVLHDCPDHSDLPDCPDHSDQSDHSDLSDLSEAKAVKGRFAPSPSGRMHLGNVFAALISWLSAKKQGGKWLLRIEDLDPQRSRYEYARLIEDDLHWLGFDWDEGGLDDKGDNPPYRQSLCGEIYDKVLHKLADAGLTYPCYCTRADIMATQAPHESDGRIVYPGTCRPKSLNEINLGCIGSAGNNKSTSDIKSNSENYNRNDINSRENYYQKDINSNCENNNRNDINSRENNSQGEKGKPVRATRLIVPDSTITFNDRLYGPQQVNLTEHCGDFILRRADGAWAYQLAVVADDARMGVTEVVRGSDLLLSSAQQIYLYTLLGLTPPEFAHVPLLCNESGQRLSKRDKSMSLEEIRKEAQPSHVIGYLAYLAGILPEPFPISAQGLLPLFSWSAIPRVASIIAR